MSFFRAFLYRQFIHYPPAPQASFKGKTIIVTGGSSGLGLEASRWLLKLGAAKIIIACRNTKKGELVARDLCSSTNSPPNAVQVWQLDLNSYASTLAFAERAKARLPRLDTLCLNAGIHLMKFRMTEDNEETITTNVVSTALLACLLHPKLRETAKMYNTHTHLTITGSELYEVAGFKEREAAGTGSLFEALSDKEKAGMFDRYNTSKLLVMYILKEMAELSPVETSGVIIDVVAPGFCATNLGRENVNFLIRFIMTLMHPRPAHVGARTIIHGASVGAEGHGQYFPDCEITPMGGLAAGAEGEKLQKRVWDELKDKLEKIQLGVTNLS